MGIKKMVYYTVKCNKCGTLLEDYVGDIPARRRSDAEDIARDNGFIQMGPNSWLCPECAKI